MTQRSGIFNVYCYLTARPIHTPIGEYCNIPAIISGVCGLLVGIGMGIGFGALIFHPFNSNSLGGGIWFGKKRRKRHSKDQHTKSDSYTLQMDHKNTLILQKIDQAKQLYDTEQK